VLRWKNFHLGYQDLGRSPARLENVQSNSTERGVKAKREMRGEEGVGEEGWWANEEIVLHEMKLYTVQCSFYFHYRSVFMMAC